MAEKMLARRTEVSVTFAGTDITEDIKPYLLEAVYTDDTDDLADDLKLTLQDRGGIWLESWLTDAVKANAEERLSISAEIKPENWQHEGTLKTGKFELDGADASGPPSVVTISATSLAFSAGLRRTKKSKAWENCTLSGIASEIAAGGGLGCMYESDYNPNYERMEQTNQSDIDFLKKLCEDAGLSIKATDGNLVLYDQAAYEAKAPVLAIEKGDKGGYIKYKLSCGSADTQYAKCRVSYTDPDTGSCIEGTAVDGSVFGEQVLEITQKVESAGEAERLALKQLRAHNQKAKTVEFTMPGDVGLVAGVTIILKGWGGWDDKYIVTSATHTVNGGGYTTQIKARKVLGY